MSSTTPRDTQQVMGPDDSQYAQGGYGRAPATRGTVGWRMARWQDWVNLVLGAWIFISPWIFGSAYGTGGANSVNSWITGGVIFLASAWAIATPRMRWLEWVNLVAAIWLFISPWVLEFANGANSNYGGAWNDWIVGVVVFILAAWAWWRPTSAFGATGGSRSRMPRRRSRL